MTYFHELKLDHLALAKKFNRYTPAGGTDTDHLVLDGKTLTNLEIFGTCVLLIYFLLFFEFLWSSITNWRTYAENNFDKGSAGTLFNVMDHCVTPFGKRLFRRWLAKPLRRVEEIEDRLNGTSHTPSQQSSTNLLR